MKELKKQPTNNVPYLAFHNFTITSSEKELKKIFGKSEMGREWLRQTSDGTVFSIYDHKERFWLKKTDRIVWHIGTYKKEDSDIAKKEIKKALKDKK